MSLKPRFKLHDVFNAEWRVKGTSPDDHLGWQIIEVLSSGEVIVQGLMIGGHTETLSISDQHGPEFFKIYSRIYTKKPRRLPIKHGRFGAL